MYTITKLLVIYEIKSTLKYNLHESSASKRLYLETASYIHEWGKSLTRHELYRGAYPLGKKGILNKALHAYPLSSSQNVRL